MSTPPFAVPGLSRESLRAAVRSDIATRLSKVCAGWTKEDFESLVEKVTDSAMKTTYSPPENRPSVSPSDHQVRPRVSQAPPEKESPNLLRFIASALHVSHAKSPRR
jgi:hypothetical protein